MTDTKDLAYCPKCEWKGEVSECDLVVYTPDLGSCDYLECPLCFKEVEEL